MGSTWLVVFSTLPSANLQVATSPQTKPECSSGDCGSPWISAIRGNRDGSTRREFGRSLSAATRAPQEDRSNIHTPGGKLETSSSLVRTKRTASHVPTPRRLIDLRTSYTRENTLPQSSFPQQSACALSRKTHCDCTTQEVTGMVRQPLDS